MLPIALAFLSSLVITLLVIRYQHLHEHLTADHDLTGVQKFHKVPVPRVGGIGVYAGVLVGLMASLWMDDTATHSGLVLLVCALPAFLAGLLEDITKQVGVRERLLATAVSALLAGVSLGAWLTRLDVPGIDGLLSLPDFTNRQTAFALTGVFSILVTAFAVSGVANAFNIIDGYNGLTGVVAIISLLGLVYVAHALGDREVVVAALVLIGAIAGFLVWNYPNGLIFLGDGGAYCIGFIIAELSVLLVVKWHEVSPWFPLLLCFYPIFETLFTIFRRLVIGKTHPGLPDAAHLHQLIYRRVVRWATGKGSGRQKSNHNALTAPYLWLMSSLAVIPATIFWRDTSVLQALALLFAVSYVWVYWSIYKARRPRWLLVKKSER